MRYLGYVVFLAAVALFTAIVLWLLKTAITRRHR